MGREVSFKRLFFWLTRHHGKKLFCLFSLHLCLCCWGFFCFFFILLNSLSIFLPHSPMFSCLVSLFFLLFVSYFIFLLMFFSFLHFLLSLALFLSLTFHSQLPSLHSFTFSYTLSVGTLTFGSVGSIQPLQQFQGKKKNTLQPNPIKINKPFR